MAGFGSLVVDASVAAKWHLPDEEDADTANAVLAHFDRGGLDLLAPDLVRHEVVSAITVATLGRAPRLSIVEGEAAIADFLALGIDVRPSAGFLPAAFSLVHQHGCALYDAVYLAMAQHLSIDFIMADRKLYQRIGHLAEVVWLGDWTPEETNDGQANGHRTEDDRGRAGR